MTAGWVDDLRVGDAPVEYELTAAGAVIAGRYDTLEDVEAAALVGVSRLAVRAWAQARVVPAVLVDGVWLVDAADLLAYDEVRRNRLANRTRRVDARPLLRQIELRGGDAEVGVVLGSAEQKALERARMDGTLTMAAADRLAVKLLGLTSWVLWGEDYLTA